MTNERCKACGTDADVFDGVCLDCFKWKCPHCDRYGVASKQAETPRP